MDFKVEDNCYVNNKFIGTTVCKKITVDILNPNNEINLENKEIAVQTGMIINGVEETVPFGNFIIEKPDTEEVKEKTSFTGYDYMIKFNTTYKNRVTYPISAGDLFEDVCEQADLEAGNSSFVNSNYMILGNPFTNNEDCRTVLSNIAQLAGGFARIGRDNKVYIISLKNISSLLKVKDVHVMTVKDLNATLVKLLSGGRSNAEETLDGNNYFEDFSKNEQWGEVNSLVLRISGIEGENTTVQDETSITTNGLTEVVIEDNYFLTDQAEREKAITPLWNAVKGIKYLPFKTEYYGYPYLDAGDLIYVQDAKDKGYVSYVFNHTFTFNGGYDGNLETPAMTKTQTAYKNTINSKTKFRQVERKIDKINGVIEDVIEQQTETTTKLTKVEQDIDSITQTVSSVEEQVDENNQSISQTNQKVTQIEQTVEGITQTVENVQTNLDENYSTTEEMNSAIEQSASSITSTVTQSIDNIQVGGTNLIPNSAPYNLEGYGINNRNNIELTLEDEETAPFGKCLRIRTLKQLDSASQWGIYITPTCKVLDTNKEYCFSIWLKATANTNVTVGYSRGGQTTFAVTTSWQKFTYKFTSLVPTGESHAFWISLPSGTILGRQVFIHSIKLEEGNKITAWSPSPDDTATKVEMNSKIEQTANEINSEVSKKVGNDEVISKINQSAEKVGINADKIELSANDVLNLIAGNEINLTSRNITIKSDAFTMDKNGRIVLTGRSKDEEASFKINTNNYYSELNAYSDGIEIKNDTAGIYSSIGVGDAQTGVTATVGVGGNGFALLTLENDTLNPQLSVGDNQGHTSTVKPDIIRTPRVQISDGGYAMYGTDTNHKYQVQWTGSRLQFLVDGSVVREL